MLQDSSLFARSLMKGKKKSRQDSPLFSRVRDALAIAEQNGLLQGRRTQIIRGRMPAALVRTAKLKSGIHSNTDLIEAALATLAVADDYAEWLLSRRGTVNPELDLEF